MCWRLEVVKLKGVRLVEVMGGEVEGGGEGRG